MVDGRPIGAHNDGVGWHTDYSYKPEPVMLTMLYAVEVPDEGAAPAMPTGRAGRGLAGVRERAALYQGSAEIGPREGGGFGVSVRLPVADP